MIDVQCRIDNRVRQKNVRRSLLMCSNTSLSPSNSCLTIVKYEKHFQKMYRDVGMAVPKTTETRCRDGSVQARHIIQRLHN